VNAVEVLVRHQRFDPEHCTCGDPLRPYDWGTSYAEHVIDELRAEGHRLVSPDEADPQP
jgi:hypothetical protein